MGMKAGANKMDQVKIRKYLAKDVPLEKISKALKIELSVIEAYANPPEDTEPEDTEPEDTEPEDTEPEEDFE